MVHSRALRVAIAAGSVIAALLAGCGSGFDSGNETAAGGSGLTASGGGGTGGAIATGGTGGTAGSSQGAAAAAGGAGGSAPACVEDDFPASADIAIIHSEGDPSCLGSIHYGSATFVFIGATDAEFEGRGLFRFALVGPVAEALTNGAELAALSIELRRATICDGNACPDEAGTLQAFPLRNDWDEGSDGTSTNYQTYAGADWCRKSNPPLERWGIDGAQDSLLDRGAQSGQADVPKAAAGVVLDLAPLAHQSAPFAALGGPDPALSVLVQATGGTRFMALSREGSLQYQAKLHVRVCSGDEP